MKSRIIATKCVEKRESVQMLIATHEVLQVVHVSNFLRTVCQIVRIWFSIQGAVNYAILMLFKNRN